MACLGKDTSETKDTGGTDPKGMLHNALLPDRSRPLPAALGKGEGGTLQGLGLWCPVLANPNGVQKQASQTHTASQKAYLRGQEKTRCGEGFTQGTWVVETTPLPAPRIRPPARLDQRAGLTGCGLSPSPGKVGSVSDGGWTGSSTP